MIYTKKIFNKKCINVVQLSVTSLKREKNVQVSFLILEIDTLHSLQVANRSGGRGFYIHKQH